MELRHLEVFLAIAEEGTLTAAGERLHLVQSGVSSTLRALETEFGAQLFTRTARKAVLTDAGAALLPEARATLAAAERARRAVADTLTEVRGPLVVGTMTPLRMIDLPRLLGRFQTDHPHVTVSMQAFPDGSAGLIRALVEGPLDVAFVSVTTPSPAGVELRELVRTSLQPVVPPGHPYADAPDVSLAELSGDRWIDSPPGFGNRTITDEAFARRSLQRTVTLETSDVTVMPGYVAAGLGVALVPGFVSLDDVPVRRKRLRDGQLFWPMFLATATSRAERRAVRAFTQAVQSEIDLFNPQRP
ncbi:DNA-binding transcriptional regulator, LysR family [Nonomuraea maritima]|uniref:DNA-binding transcriptional regulator, LysR family n=1 Tax=Nonomuraea maritima TaxID=683260 RepID=A0A1G9JI14_9ACTN|nr:LysR family transcriptional regulator [Nonomuraea maritima]SDL37118.1 DNA-binding transcriptional regulator, LysR family [Nonomuraea maritima]